MKWAQTLSIWGICYHFKFNKYIYRYTNCTRVCVSESEVNTPSLNFPIFFRLHTECSNSMGPASYFQHFLFIKAREGWIFYKHVLLFIERHSQSLKLRKGFHTFGTPTISVRFIRISLTNFKKPVETILMKFGHKFRLRKRKPQYLLMAIPHVLDKSISIFK